jgi:hypothetical protein
LTFRIRQIYARSVDWESLGGTHPPGNEEAQNAERQHGGNRIMVFNVSIKFWKIHQRKQLKS